MAAVAEIDQHVPADIICASEFVLGPAADIPVYCPAHRSSCVCCSSMGKVTMPTIKKTKSPLKKTTAEHRYVKAAREQKKIASKQVAAEELRVLAEKLREGAEQERQEAEEKRGLAEYMRELAENARTQAEESRAAAEELRAETLAATRLAHQASTAQLAVLTEMRETLESYRQALVQHGILPSQPE